MQRFFILSLFYFSSFILSAQHTLKDYVQSAVANSPLIIDNFNQQRSLAYDSMLIRAALRPQVNLTSNDLYAPVINGYGYDEIITNGGNYNALLGVNYLVTGRKNLNNQFSLLNIQGQLLEFNRKLTERELIQNVSVQYIAVYGSQQLLANSEKILGILQEENIILKGVTEKGRYQQTEYLTFLVGLRQQQLAYEHQKLQMQSDLFTLNYLCGIVDTATVVLADPEISLSQNMHVDQTFPFQQFRLDSLQFQFSVEQIKFRYSPKLNLLGDAGYNTTFLYHAERNFGASVGLSLTVPIYNGHQRQLQESKIVLSQNTLQSKSAFFIRQFNAKQLALNNQLSQTEQLITEAQEQLKLSEGLLKANNKLLEMGDTRIFDYMQSLRNFISAQATVQQLITNRMLLINQLNYLNH